MQRTYELHALSNVAGNTSAFHTINDYNRVTLIVHMERNVKLAGLTTAAAPSAWVVLLLSQPHRSLFVVDAPWKHCSRVYRQHDQLIDRFISKTSFYMMIYIFFLLAQIQFKSP